MNLGANIRRKRYELKMSQQELADLMGYKTRSTIAKIESGENDVSQKKLIKFASVLNTTVEALLCSTASKIENSEAKPNMDKEIDKSKKVVIVLAGGKSGKNQQNIPNQFINVDGKPIIIHCLEAYQKHPSIDDIYVVCLKGWENIVLAYAEEYGINKIKGIIQGGNSGIMSLKKCVDKIKDTYSPKDYIIIQEATRPLVITETISKLLHECEYRESAIICHSMKDYVQFSIAGKYAEQIERESTIAIQSPEAHRLSLINKVFDNAAEHNHPLTETCFTMLLYNLGYDINFVESEINNIKISKEEDIATYAALLRSKRQI